MANPTLTHLVFSFAQRAMKVTNKPRVNEIISEATMIKQLHNQIKTLKVELDVAKKQTIVRRTN